MSPCEGRERAGGGDERAGESPTTTQLLKTTSIPADNAARPLLYRPPYDQATWEVTTVYLRSFYGPADYPEETAWAARLHLERSAAIKCPSVLGQLAGCKKVQQHLADPAGEDHLSRFLDGKVDKATVELVRATFAPQYDLRDGGPGRELALDPAAAERHVLKPQREGGGNNIYRGAIPDFLRSIPEREWNGYILMELIQPPEGARNIARRDMTVSRPGTACCTPDLCIEARRPSVRLCKQTGTCVRLARSFK
ncbi:hypothetical protein KEM52_001850 [Ascosphaera acerosa]|nr:hypothetical protein KEM52_001850 [Ascosphaera acerosa]